MNFIEDLAFALHEEWRKTRLKSDGSYEPSWKDINDDMFIYSFKDSEFLPSYLRKNENGKWQIDIANACYSQLSEDLQADNQAVAEVIANIIESGKNYKTKKIGKVIYDALLEKKAYAEGRNFNVPFKKLPSQEQNKYLAQYEMGLKIKEATKNNYYPDVETLDGLINKLYFVKESNDNSIFNFKGKYFYTLFDTEDSCYVKFYGKNKKDYNRYYSYIYRKSKEKTNLSVKDKTNAKKEEYKEAVKNISEYKEIGYKMIFPQKKEQWDKCVESNIAGLYDNILEDSIMIMKALDENKNMNYILKNLYRITNEKGYTGGSWSVMEDIVTKFSKRGPEFYRATNKVISEDTEKYLQKLESENKQLEKMSFKEGFVENNN